jgi:hypothetical protein
MVRRVGCGLVATFVSGADTIGLHELANPFLAHRQATRLDFPGHPWRTIGTIKFGMDSANESLQLWRAEPALGS